MQGFINLNKPLDWTSHDCVARVRRLLHTSRVGHGGTLDPAASGVLPIAIGKATRLLQFLPQDKAYRATIQLGITTTTDDLEGEILTSQPATDLSLEQIVPKLKQFQGKIVQIPPKYSAIQVGGKRLYDLARAGEEVDVPERTVEVYKIEILNWQAGDFPKLEVAIACGAGTYIRAIARDLGAALGTGGTLAALTRTRSSGFEIAASLSLDELATQLERGTFEPIPPAKALQHLPSVNLSEPVARKWCLGQKIPYPEVPVTMTNDTCLRVENEGDRFLGIGRLVQTDDVCLLAPQIVFVPS
ncbi:tRNA pseudouridine(55) synthase TruB [Chroococcidiopsis sp. CCNUC1]|uniref:tRNA pseudouridine(55) synthase TruB n=1 Tax=Chroococcidiopsis sp. CCNUC1 TaxID=2653189 RepID=UPI002020B922|nr:tRNA pseudouridine(55) synthase TruB [Chroococcidiopsis sp. CCNUC1]URD50853.1 tRNA pseudouridine(55) synthase TruB [Chroococcidiopsis sp. CCNUC1]